MTISKRIAERMLEDAVQRKADNAQRAFAFGKSPTDEPYFLNAYLLANGGIRLSQMRHSSRVQADNLARAMGGYDRTLAYRIRVIPKETHA